MQRVLGGAARVFRLVAAVALTFGILVSSAWAQNGSEPAFLSFGAGAFDFRHSDSIAAQGEIQYRSDLKLWIFNPMAGFAATTDGAFYAYAGISLDIFLGKRLVIRPSFAPGFFEEGSGKDLGHHIEFRSAVEIAYRFDDRSRLGLEFYHRSNAGIGEKNPGEESLMLTYALPMSRIFGQ
jgi:lipid A 3-O-deacylase